MRLFNYAYKVRIVLTIMFSLMLLVSSAGAVGFLDRFTKKNTSAITIDQASKVDISVKGLSCSSCISQIKGALSGTDGIVETIVDLGSNTAKVYYDPSKISDPSVIANKITAIGYPATVSKVYTSIDLEKQEKIAAQKSKLYIASVGDYDVSRSDYEIELSSIKNRYEKNYPGVFKTPRGALLESSLKSQVASKLIRDGVMLQEVLKANYKLSDEFVDSQLESMLKGSGKSEKVLIAELRDAGMPYEYFKKQFINQLLINKYLEEKVFASASTSYEKQSAYQNWYLNASSLAPVIYFDKELEANANRQGSGSGCCPTN